MAEDEGSGLDPTPARRDEADAAERRAGEADQRPEETETGQFGPGGWFAAKLTSGPLPEATEYDLYEATYPGSAERILQLTERAMDLTEREAEHRHRIENRIVDGNLKNQSRGQIIATFFGIVGFVTAITFVALGMNVAAFIAVLVPLGAFISRFIQRPNGR